MKKSPLQRRIIFLFVVDYNVVVVADDVGDDDDDCDNVVVVVVHADGGDDDDDDYGDDITLCGFISLTSIFCSCTLMVKDITMILIYFLEALISLNQ